MEKSLKHIQNHTSQKYSIVILCYKAGESTRNFVNKVIRSLNRASISNYEIILVGNYHKNEIDPTPYVIQALAKNNPNIKYSTIPKQGMMGWDMRTGLTKASGDYIAVIDGDGQMPTYDLIRVFKMMISTDADLVKTNRRVRGDGLLRKFISLIFNWTFVILFPGLKCRDINSKPKIFRRSSFEKMELTDDGWFIDAEMMIQARRLKFKIIEIATKFKGLDSSRNSFINLDSCKEFLIKFFIFRIREFKHR